MCIAMKQLFEVCLKSTDVVQDTHAQTHGQYAIVSLARFTESLPDKDSCRPEYLS